MQRGMIRFLFFSIMSFYLIFGVGIPTTFSGDGVETLCASPMLDEGKEPNSSSSSQISESTVAEIDAYLKTYMERQNVPGLSLAIVQDGRVVLAKGYGLANVELKVPATSQTVYQIQSITKQFTATAIMMLVEEHKLDLDEKVSHYLEGTPKSWENITLRHLLTHTSGIKDFINEPIASLRLDVTEQEVFEDTVPRPLNFTPGEKYAYSNTNYHLLAMIIRKVTDKRFGEFLRDRIFVPLEMNDTRILSLSEIIPNRAAGYLRGRDGLRNGNYIAQSVLAYGGGGIRSTVLDMAKWDAALYSEKLLKKSSLDQMWTPARLNNGKLDSYGFGWQIGEVRGHRFISHNGAHSTGFSTHIGRFVDDRLTIIVLTNARHADATGIGLRVAELYNPSLRPVEEKSTAAR